MTLAQEVLSPESVDAMRLEVLKKIPQTVLPSILRRHNLPREVVIGIVGMRGDGKSASGASLALLDYMLEGRPVWSNMDIACSFYISDDIAQKWNIRKGGTVEFRTDDLDKKAFLRFDPRYKHGCFFVDEINMEFSESRRFMTNTNLFFNRVVQQLRKYETHMIYTVINEMFVDQRLRELTDIFIKCEDTALSISGLIHNKQPGTDFKWIPYPMTGFLAGKEHTYYYTKKPLAPVYFHFKPLRGIYDDKQFQMPETMYYGVNIQEEGTDDRNIKQMSFKRPNVVKDWGWLVDVVRDMVDEGSKYIPAHKIRERADVVSHRISDGELSRKLREMFGIFSIWKWHGGFGRRVATYEMPDEGVIYDVTEDTKNQKTIIYK